jgi:hypothetical protein
LGKQFGQDIISRGRIINVVICEQQHPLLNILATRSRNLDDVDVFAVMFDRPTALSVWEFLSHRRSRDQFAVCKNYRL